MHTGIIPERIDGEWQEKEMGLLCIRCEKWTLEEIDFEHVFAEMIAKFWVIWVWVGKKNPRKGVIAIVDVWIHENLEISEHLLKVCME